MFDLTAYQILDRIYYFLFSFILIPIVIGISKRKDLSKSDSKILLLLVALLILEIFSELLRWNRMRNHFVSFPVTFFLFFFSLQYFFISKLQSLMSKFLLGLAILTLIFTEVFIAGFNQLNSITKSLSFVSVLVLSVIHLKKLFSNNEMFEFSRNPSFWYSIAFSIWGSFAFLPSLLERYFIETSINLYYFFDTLRLLGFAISCIIFAIGLNKISQKTKF